jgi:hypothetical protein
MKREAIYELFDEKRIKQDLQHHGPDHDKLHSDADWCLIIEKKIVDLKQALYEGNKRAVNDDFVSIGAIVVARFDCIEE